MTSFRDVSSALKRQLFRPFRDQDIRVLLTVDHADFAEPFRFVSGDPNEFASLESNGETFITFPFSITLLGDGEGEPEAQLTIQNADDRIGTTLLELSSDTVTVTLEIVMRDTPDTVEYQAVNLELVDVTIDAIAVTGKLVVRGLATEPCPGRVLTNTISPAFFR